MQHNECDKAVADKIEEQIRFQDISVLPLHTEVLYLSGNLPKLHKDLFDRVIAAEAL